MTNYFDLTNKTALIVGASSGIGEHFAKTLAEAGARVILAARRFERLQALQSSLEKAGHQVMIQALDVTDEDSVSALFTRLDSENLNLDIMVNTAGIMMPCDIEDGKFSDWRKLMAVNVDGCWLVAQQTAQHMLKRNIAGSIIQISSIAAVRTFNTGFDYQVSKAGVEQLTRSMACALAPKNIRVNCIAPGWFETDINHELLQTSMKDSICRSIPCGRIGELKELSGALLLLASDASSYMTGSILRVDGGYATQHLAIDFSA